MGSLQIFKRLQLELGYDMEFRASGALQAIQTQEQYDYTRDRVLAMKVRGYTLELLAVNEARGLEPELNPDLWGAVHFPLRAQADPVKATQAFAEAAARQGAQVLTGCNVTAITRQANGAYRVSCDGEERLAERLILAAGAWCGPLGRMLGWIYPSCRYGGRCGLQSPCPQEYFTPCLRQNRQWTGHKTRNNTRGNQGEAIPAPRRN